MPRRLLPLLLTCWPALAHAYDLELELGLYNRFGVTRNHVERTLRYDPQAGAFDTASYLNPSQHETYYGVLASAAVLFEPARWLGVGVTVDSGEVRPRGQLPAVTEVPLDRMGRLLGIASLPALSTESEHPVTSNGQRFADEAKETYLLREAYLRLAAPRTHWLTFTAGRRATDIGDGLIYNDYGLGARLDADLELLRGWPVRFSGEIVFPSRAFDGALRSPLVTLRASYLISLFEEVGLVFAYFHDGDDSFDQALAPLVAEAAVRLAPRIDPQLHREIFALATGVANESSADLYWLGLSGSKLIGDLTLSGTALLQLGSMRIGNPFAELGLLAQQVGARLPVNVPTARSLERSSLAAAVDLRASYPLGDDWTVGAFFLLLTGEDNPLLTRDGTQNNSFISIVPHLTHTNLFFSGGMNETFSGRRGATAGLNGRGVIAPGAEVDWEATRALTLRGKAAALLATAPSLHGGTLYGGEFDLQGRYAITDWLAASVEYDLLVPGGFFSDRSLMHKLLVGLDVTYSYER